MSKSMKKIKKIQDILINLIAETQKILDIIEVEEDKKIKESLNELVISYCYINMTFNLYLMKLIPESYKKEIIDKEFFKIVKPLENPKENNDGKQK